MVCGGVVSGEWKRSGAVNFGDSGAVPALQVVVMHSVPANIAEGSSKESNREFARYLQIASGSAAELHYHLRFAMDSALIPRSAGETLLAETTSMRKMLHVLLRRVREAIPASHHKP
jgi:hypothetical protein